MNIVCLSGAAFKITVLLGQLVAVMRVFKVKVFVGISSGAILAFVAAVGRLPQLINILLSFKAKDVFVETPNSVWGKIMAFARLFMGKLNLYDQSKLKETLKRYISIEDFDEWQSNTKSPACYVGVVDIESGNEVYLNLKELDYESAIDAVLASSSIPIFTAPVLIGKSIFYDGGLRSHIPSVWAANRFKGKATRIISLFSRPRALAHASWSYPVRNIWVDAALGIMALLFICLQFASWIKYSADVFAMKDAMAAILIASFFLFKKMPILGLLSRVLDILNWEISKSDEELSDSILSKSDTEHIKVFSPYKLTDAMYDVSSDEQRYWYELGIKEAEQELHGKV